MIMRKLFYLLAGLGLSLAACSDYDDSGLVNRLDDMDKRLTTLEETIAAMNQDIKGVQTMVAALEGNVYVAKVETSDTGYTIYFTNGEKIEISDGKAGEAGKDAPSVTVKLNEDDGLYYWAMTKDGVTDYIVDGAGKPIPVKGEKGTTPLLRVTKEGETGYWEVSYDEGATWGRVMDAEGNPVTTSGGAGGLFTSAEIVEDKDTGKKTAVFTFLNGEKLEIELRSDLYMLFKGEAPTSEIPFRYGETKTFEMEAVGVLKTVVTKPDEWSASYDLSTNTLSVTAPAVDHKTCSAPAGEVGVIYFGKENQSSAITFEVAIGEFVTIDETLLTVEAASGGDTYLVPFTADGDITLSLENPADSWIVPAVAGENIQLVVAANTGNQRSGKVIVKAKHNSLEITVNQPAGAATVDKGMRAESGVKKWNTPLADAGFAAPNDASSIAAVGDYVLVNVPGENPIIFDARTGQKHGVFELAGAPNDIITADDAGHIILCNYNADAAKDFTIWRARDINSAPELFATYAGGNPIGRKISVTGDIYGDAVVMIPYSAWSAGGVTVYWRWDVKGGAAVGEKPVWKKMGTDVVPYTQNIDMVAAYPDASSDFFYIGYSGSVLHWMGADHSIKAKIGITPDAYLSNFISNDIDTEVFNNQLYVAITADDLWGPGDRMWVIEATADKWTGDLSNNSPAVAYSLPVEYNIVANYYQDVALRVSADGLHMYAYYMFGGVTVGCVEFDCLAQ